MLSDELLPWSEMFTGLVLPLRGPEPTITTELTALGSVSEHIGDKRAIITKQSLARILNGLRPVSWPKELPVDLAVDPANPISLPCTDTAPLEYQD